MDAFLATLVQQFDQKTMVEQGSPPEKVTPPSDWSMIRVSRLISFMTSFTDINWPDISMALVGQTKAQSPQRLQRSKSVWIPGSDEPQGLLLTDFDAFLAADTLAFRVQFLYLPGHAFGVVAPDAGQGAAFEEKGDPDARPVIEGKALDVEYEAGLGHWLG
jgi:hypothetical protein